MESKAHAEFEALKVMKHVAECLKAAFALDPNGVDLNALRMKIATVLTPLLEMQKKGQFSEQTEVGKPVRLRVAPPC